MKFRSLLLAAACACPLPAYAGAADSKPTDDVTLALNANNPSDVLGLVEVDAEYIASGAVTARAINPRTVSASLRFSL